LIPLCPNRPCHWQAVYATRMGRRRCLVRPGSYGLTCDGQYLAFHWSLAMTLHGSTETSSKINAECVLLVCLVTAVLYGWRAEWRRAPCRPDAPVSSKLLTSKVCPKISSHSLRQYLPRGLHIRKPSPMVTESPQCFQDHIDSDMQVCVANCQRVGWFDGRLLWAVATPFMQMPNCVSV